MFTKNRDGQNEANASTPQKVKKPLYKRWWVWLLGVFVVFALIPTNNDQTPSDPEIPPADNIEQTDSGKAPDAATPAETDSSNNWTMSQKNAMGAAKNYLSIAGFSHDALVKQLVFDQYSQEDATWAADNCGADWNQEAQESSKNYVSIAAFSYDGLIKQLEFDGFTHDQAVYGADNSGADWNQEAAEGAKTYLSLMEFSRDALIEQLKFDGFTHDQAAYGATQNGY